MTYLTHWGFSEAPFDNVPDPRFYFPSGQHEEARQRLLYGIRAAKGAVMLTGEIGSGKTLTSRALVHSLPLAQYDVALMANPALPTSEFLIEILYQFGIEATGSKVHLLHQLNDRLATNRKHGIGSILMIDEAQSIESDAVFEDLRLLLNFQLNSQFLLTIVLIGQPELRYRVGAIPQLNQRIAIRYHLWPFSEEETKEYIRFRIRAAGGKPDLFVKEALEELYQCTGGICRVINHLCDLCLFLGAQENATQIEPSLVQQASRTM